LAAALAIVIVAIEPGSAQQAAGPFTAAQAAAGRAAYTQNCAGCHGADLSGQGNAAPLAGGLFMGGWGDKSPADLISFLQGAMPPGNPGGLGEQNYVVITAYILEQNGARAGNQALTAGSRVTISTVATGQRPPQNLAAQAQGKGKAAPPPAPRGITVP